MSQYDVWNYNYVVFKVRFRMTKGQYMVSFDDNMYIQFPV